MTKDVLHRRKQCHDRIGFSLVELVVAITIIAVLVSLLFPAIQESRVAARRTQFKSNLRQLGLATLSFLDSSHGKFPINNLKRTSEIHKPAATVESWCLLILPHLEQSNTFKSYDRDQWYWIDGNLDLTKTPIPVFDNPVIGGNVAWSCDIVMVAGTKPAMLRNPFDATAAGFNQTIRDSDYPELHNGCAATDRTPLTEDPGTDDDGQRNRTIAEITDGMSNTLMFAPSRANHMTAMFDNEQTIGDAESNRFSIRVHMASPFNPMYTIATLGTNPTTGKHEAFGGLPNKPEEFDDLSVRHGILSDLGNGSTEVALCDGSVRTMLETIDSALLGHLAIRNDGEVTGEW